MDRNYWLRNGATGARRVNRRRLLQYGGFSAAALATTALVGCGDDDDDTGSNTPGASPTSGGGTTPEATPTTGSVTRGGTLRFGFNRDIQGLDPAKVTDSYVGFIFVGGLYDGLINYTNDYQLGAGLAEEWETPDDTTINLTIRQGVTFHDGEPLTAEAVKANLERIIAADSTAKDKASLIAVDSISVTGDNIVQIKLKNPDSVVLPLLGDYAGLMASPAAFDNLMTNPVGTGPMKFTAWDKGNKVSLEKNPNYWGKAADGGSLPYLDGFEYLVIPDLEQQINSLKTDQVDLLTLIVGDSIGRIKDDSDLQYISGPSRLLRTMFINMSMEGLDRQEVRQALAQSVDREALIAAAYGGFAGPAASLATPGDWVYDSSIPAYEYNINEAKQLLSAAGYEDGLKLTVLTTGAPSEFQTLTDIIKPQIAQAGIEIEYQTIDATAAFQLIYREGKSALNLAGNDGRADFGQVVDVFLAKGGGLNLTSAADPNWTLDPEIQDLATRGRQALDQEERKDIYSELQQQVHDKVYNQNVLCYPEQGWAASKKVQGLNWYQDARFRLHEVHLES